MRICVATDCIALQVTDVLEHQLARMLPKDVKLVLKQAIFDHLRLIVPQ